MNSSLRSTTVVKLLLLCGMLATGAQAQQQKSMSTELKTMDKCEYASGAVVINTDPEAIWTILVDYDHSPNIFPNLKACHVEGEKGDAKRIRQIVEPSKLLKLDYVVLLTENKPKSMTWFRESGSLKEVKGSWELTPLEGGKKTRVVYNIHLDGGPILPAWLLDRQAKGYLPTVLTALKKKAETDAEVESTPSVVPTKTTK